MNNYNFSVFFTAFKEKNAVEFSLALLNKLYPQIDIFLVSDGGEDFSYIQNYLSNVRFYMGQDTISKTFEITDANFKLTKHQETMKISIQILFDRLQKSIDLFNKEYILMMDPDTLIRGRINIPKDAKLLGTKVNSGHIITEEFISVLNSIEGAKIFDSWGATPTIFHVETYKRALSVLNNNPNLLNKLCASTYAMYAHDFLFPTLFALVGEEEQENPEIVECTRNKNWMNTNHPIVHQFKFLYPQ